MNEEHEERLDSIRKDIINSCDCEKCETIRMLERKVKNREKLTEEDWKRLDIFLPEIER